MDNELVERVARAMCVAEGLDPDAEALVSADDIFGQRRGEDVLLGAIPAPTWKRYARMARMHLSAQDAVMRPAGT
ncbi:hypothetical protein [Consotaella aegiceratis]|uniref:hypothetical protein n=1 Tax=Consotaella aegiceratis TaxID=3097961 RepID=UPI002F4224AC